MQYYFLGEVIPPMATGTLPLAAVPGVAFTGSIDQIHSLASVHGHHGYDPEYKEMMTGFNAAGAGIQKGMVIPRMDLVDVAPLIARLLGLEFKAPDGILYPGILKTNNERSTINTICVI